MAWYHSTLLTSFGLGVEQIPLSPRHAHSSADRGIARLNKFFRRLMRVTHLRGASQFTEALKLATVPPLTSPGRLLKNISVEYRHFKSHDWCKVPQVHSFQRKVSQVQFQVVFAMVCLW